MSYRLEILPIVYRDILDIELYIARDKPSAAKKVVKNITTAIRTLAENPFIAIELSKKFEIDSTLRGLVVKPHVIIYDVVETNIRVYRVLDCRSDYLTILGFNT